MRGAPLVFCRDLKTLQTQPFRERLQQAPPVVCIGNFDGIHQGHARLFQLTREKAGASAKVVLTFEPHPRLYFARSRADAPPFEPLVTFRQKYERLEEEGFDLMLGLRFNHELAELSPEAFVKTVLVEGLRAKEVVVGFDWAFGKGRTGNTETLKALGKQYGFDVCVAEPVMLNGQKVSSTAIREAIREGDVVRAADLLGHPYSITGHVQHGASRGKNIGFATANLAVGRGHQCAPRHGVYAIHAIGSSPEGEFRLPGVANIGVRPTFGGGDVVLEAHLFTDRELDLYGSRLTVEFAAFLRPEQKFNSVDELRVQISKDVAAARAIFQGPARK